MLKIIGQLCFLWTALTLTKVSVIIVPDADQVNTSICPGVSKIMYLKSSKVNERYVFNRMYFGSVITLFQGTWTSFFFFTKVIDYQILINKPSIHLESYAI